MELANKKNVLILDLETTGLDPEVDEIIEFGGILCEFDPELNRLSVLTVYSSLREPKNRAIDANITKITGIEPSQVAGQDADWAFVQSLIDQADILIAHNAAFDRGFLEKADYVDVEGSHWGCSVQHIDWLTHGFKSRSLNYLAADKGFVNAFAHRACFDCATLLRVLDGHFAELWETSFQKQYQVFAHRAPFAKKDLLKSRNYRWDPKKSVWHKILFEKNLKDEELYLETSIYEGQSFHEATEM